MQSINVKINPEYKFPVTATKALEKIGNNTGVRKEILTNAIIGNKNAFYICFDGSISTSFANVKWFLDTLGIGEMYNTIKNADIRHALDILYTQIRGMYIVNQQNQ